MAIPNQIAAKLIRQFPKAGSLTLAKIAYRDNKAVFSSIEQARTAVRRARGNQGVKMRSKVPNKALFRPNGKAGEGAFPPIPKGSEELPGWCPLRIFGPVKALILSDIHAPYHSADALAAALRFGIERKAGLIILNGDNMDGCAVSHWQRDPRERDFPGEIKMMRSLLGAIQTRFPKARIIWKDGNHEERFRSYMICRAPDLLGLPEFELAAVLHLNHYGIEYVTDRRPILLGGLTVIHGHEWGKGSSIQPAKRFFSKASTDVLGGHLHRPDSWYAMTPDGRQIEAWSTGCLCDMRPRYATLNNWRHGFAFVEVDKAGAFRVENIRL